MSTKGNASAGSVMPVEIEPVRDDYIAESASGQSSLKEKCPHLVLNVSIKTKLEAPVECEALVLGHVPGCRNWYVEAKLENDELYFSHADDCFSPPDHTKGCNANDRCTFAGGKTP